MSAVYARPLAFRAITYGKAATSPNRSRLLPTSVILLSGRTLAKARFGWGEVGPRQRAGWGGRPCRKILPGWLGAPPPPHPGLTSAAKGPPLPSPRPARFDGRRW